MRALLVILSLALAGCAAGASAAPAATPDQSATVAALKQVDARLYSVCVIEYAQLTQQTLSDIANAGTTRLIDIACGVRPK